MSMEVKKKINFVISVSVLIILVLPKFENTSGFVCQAKSLQFKWAYYTSYIP